EPVVAGPALEDLEHLAALGDEDLAVAPVGPRMHRSALCDHAQIGLGVCAARPEERDQRQEPGRRGGEETRLHLNQARKTTTAGSLMLGKISAPPWGSIPASGLVKNRLADGVPQLR